MQANELIPTPRGKREKVFLSRWKCRECGSLNVEIALPCWFREDRDMNLHQIDGPEDEAEPMAWSCNECFAYSDGCPAPAVL